MDIWQQFDSYQPIENNVGRKDRYRYAKAKLAGSSYFVKQSLVQTDNENLCRELVWQDFMQVVEKTHPGLRVRSLRKMRLAQDDTLVAEWVEAPLVAYPGKAAQWRKHLQRYTDILVALDSAAGQYVVPSQLRRYHERIMRERLDSWLQGTPRTALINQAYADVINSLPRLPQSMQHGDLTPWQIFAHDDEWIIIDGERSGDDLPRFNDIAYSYGRLAARCDDLPSADVMLQRFIDQRRLSQDVIRSQLKPVLLLRLLGMLGDAAKDSNAAEYARVESIVQRWTSDTPS